MKRKTIWLGLALAALGTVGALVGFGGGHSSEYRTAPIRRGPIDSTISATGNLNAVVTVSVGSQVSGNISALYADFNTRVKKGQLVARIDPEIFQAKVNQAQANLDASQAAVGNAQAAYQKAVAEVSNAQAMLAVAQANVAKEQANLDNAKLNYTRQSKLAADGVAARADSDTAQASYQAEVAAVASMNAQVQAARDMIRSAEAARDVAKAQVTSAQAQVAQQAAALRQAQIDLQHTYITAPVDGVVVSRQVDVGQTVAASLQAPTIFQIAQDLTKMQVDTNVDEADVGHVAVGQPATFTVDAFPSRRFHGTVTQIRKAPINVQNVVTYDVVIGVSNADLKLFPGMTANVQVLVDHRDDALLVPNAALRFRPLDAKVERNFRGRAAGQTLYVLGQDGKLAAVPVKVGINDGTNTEVIAAGLKPGEPVIVGMAKETAASPAFGGGPRGPRPF